MNAFEQQLTLQLGRNNAAKLEAQIPAQMWQQLQQRCLKIERLSAGLSNDNYRLRCIDSDKVLRINASHTMWCDRSREVSCWQQAYLHDLAPKLLWHSSDNHYYLSEFIEVSAGGHTKLNLNTSSDVLPALLLKCLLSLQQVPVPTQSISVTEQYQQYLQRLMTYSDEAGTESFSYSPKWQLCVEQLQSAAYIIKQALLKLESCLISPIFCHRDLSPDNLLLTTTLCQQPRFICIDFEYAIASHPLIDFASLLASHILNTKQQQHLIDGYFDHHAQRQPPVLTQEAKHCVNEALAVYWLYNAMWALLMQANKERVAANDIAYDLELEHQQTFNQEQVHQQTASEPNVEMDYLAYYSQCFSTIKHLLAL